MATNLSYASPPADATFAHLVSPGNVGALVGQVLTGVKIWQIVLTLFLGLVIYDQSKADSRAWRVDFETC